MQRTKLRNKFLKDPNMHNKHSCIKQKKWSVFLLRIKKKDFNEKDDR